jgi:hypothetical protein
LETEKIKHWKIYNLLFIADHNRSLGRSPGSGSV